MKRIKKNVEEDVDGERETEKYTVERDRRTLKLCYEMFVVFSDG